MFAAIDVQSPFDYMFPQLANDPSCRLPDGTPGEVSEVRKNLEELGRMMARQGADKGNSKTVPAGYTYWGQFIDHDITASSLKGSAGIDIIDQFNPLSPDQVVAKLFNLRRPALDLDSVFGDGPNGEALPFYEDDGIRLRIGQNVIVRAGNQVLGEIPPDGQSGPGSPGTDLRRDLPRNEMGVPQIPDRRNDENLIVAQLHVGFIRFYNAVVDNLAAEPRKLTGAALLNEAMRLTRWHYQWLVVNDYLMTVAQHSVVRDILTNHGRFFRRSDHDPFSDLFMPIEFSVAAFRFGHSMVRSRYDFNRNFGRPSSLLKSSAPLEDLFSFTGKGRGAVPNLPHHWIIEWDRFFNKQDNDGNHMARKFDTWLELPLSQMENETTDKPNLTEVQKSIMEHLAKRNLLRGYLFSLPTGQCVAEAMGETKLTSQQLSGAGADLNALLERAGFLERTPLWYYLLKEAELTKDLDAEPAKQACGNKLGPIGSRIVAETIIGLIRSDSSSYLNQASGFDPASGDAIKFGNGRPITTITDLLRFAGVAV